MFVVQGPNAAMRMAPCSIRACAIDEKLSRLRRLLDACETLQSSTNFGLTCSIAVMTTPSPSSVHETGLQATIDLEAGTVFSLYPVHVIGCSSDSVYHPSHESDHHFFSSKELQRYWIDLPVDASFGLASWAEDAWIGANPHRPLHAGWTGHLVNDAAVCNAPTYAAIAQYYSNANQQSNCLMCPFGPAPIFCWVTTRRVEAGEELFGLYGHDYWLEDQSMMEHDQEQVSLLAAKYAERAFKAHRALEEQYERDICMLHRWMQNACSLPRKTN